MGEWECTAQCGPPNHPKGWARGHQHKSDPWSINLDQMSWTKDAPPRKGRLAVPTAEDALSPSRNALPYGQTASAGPSPCLGSRVAWLIKVGIQSPAILFLWGAALIWTLSFPCGQPRLSWNLHYNLVVPLLCRVLRLVSLFVCGVSRKPGISLRLHAILSESDTVSDLQLVIGKYLLKEWLS